MRAFLSHSSADNSLATRIYRFLRDQPASIWFDRVELRPGDSLLSRIAAGIGSSDALLALITETSKRSPWVTKEISIAVTQEVNGKGPRVIPLLVKGCEIPEILADKIYIPIEESQIEFSEIIPAIFRSSYFLDIVLQPADLEVDSGALRSSLHEYYRSKFESALVRFVNHDFNRKVIETARRSIEEFTTQEFEHRDAVIRQVSRAAESYDITLPLFWTNLSQLLAQTTSDLFDHFGKNLDALSVALKSITNTWRICHFKLASHLSSAIFPLQAEKFGFADLAAFMRRHEEPIHSNDDEAVVHEILGVRAGEGFLRLGLQGLEDKRVWSTNILWPTPSETDRLMLQMTCDVSLFISHYQWYVEALPQIIGHTAFWTAFREGKPLHELDYQIGLKMEDYQHIGLA